MKRHLTLAALAALVLLVGCPGNDTEPPSVTIVSPSGTVNRGDIVIKAVATDNKAVAKVEFYVAGTLEGTDNIGGAGDTFRYVWSDTAAQVPGQSYALSAKAYDAAENSATSATVTITIAGGGGGTGPTRHRGEIPADETWWPSGNPHIIEDDVWTGNNVTLTIKPGCVVQFAAGAELYTGYSYPGSIIAVGTPDSVITFTALSDTVPGFWEDIGFYGNTISTARLSYCHVLFGGKGSSDNSAVYVQDCNVRIDHTTIRKSGGYGVCVEDDGSFGDFSNNTITGCTKHPVRIDANFVRTIGTGNVLTGNAKEGIHVHNGGVETDGTWLNHGVPYVVDGDVYVQSNATLTISAGTTVSLDPGVEFYCGYSSPGSIVAVGTPSSPVTFTSLTDTVAGIWEALSFYDQTMSNARLSYCIVERAGGSNTRGAVYVQGCHIKMDNCTVRKNAKYGVFVDDGGYFDDFTNNTITTSGEYPVGIEADKARTLGTGNVLTGNTKDGILVEGGNIARTGTWLNHAVPYVVSGDAYVSDATNNPVLTIAPGTTVKVTPHSEFYVGYGAPGGLIADGTSGQITFTSSVNPPSAGDWDGLSFYSQSISSECQLKNCRVEYGGYDDCGNIYIYDCTPTVTGCDIRSSANWGIYLDGDIYPDPVALEANNTFYECPSGKVRVPPK